MADVRPIPRRLSRADVVGLSLVASLGLWVGLVSGDGDGRPLPVLLLLVGVVAATALGRLLTRQVPPLVALGVAGAIFLSWPAPLAADGGPTGYANANATLAGLGALAAVSAAVTARDGPPTRRWLGLSGILVLAAAATGSIAGSASLVVAFVLLGLGAIIRWPVAVIGGGLIAVSIAIGVTSAVAVGGDPAGLGDRAGIRAELWTAAADFADSEPIRGIGPGEFSVRNPVTGDDDLRWAHHGYLQVAAELGVMGLALLLAIAGWVWAALLQVSRHAPVSACMGAAAFVLVALHATVDYIFHVPVVLIVAAVLVGNATATPRGPAGSGDRSIWSFAVKSPGFLPRWPIE